MFMRDQRPDSASSGERALDSRVYPWAILGLTVAAIVAMVLAPRVSQDESYHQFADQRSVLGVDNFLNVVSNLPFLIAGIAGLVFVIGSKASSSFLNRFERWPYIVFFFGVTLTCFGSAYYHLSPSTERLMWDRLPMSIAFMSLLAAVIVERINRKAGLVLLAPLVLIGAASVIYWHFGEQNGRGDLRPYILVQFYSLLVIILATILLPSAYSRGGELLGASLGYAFAKVLELLDSQILAAGRIVSGHSLKHIVAAASVYWIFRMLKHRVRTSQALTERQAAIP
jgi:hypothetical protein